MHVCDVSVVLDTTPRVANRIVHRSDMQRSLRETPSMPGEVLQPSDVQIWRRGCIAWFQIEERVDGVPGSKEFSNDSVMIPARMWIATAVFRWREPERLARPKKASLGEVFPKSSLRYRCERRLYILRLSVRLKRTFYLISQRNRCSPHVALIPCSGISPQFQRITRSHNWVRSDDMPRYTRWVR